MTASCEGLSAVAQEIWCHTRRGFTAAHRGLWHLAHLRCGVTLDNSRTWASDDPEPVSIVHVEPQTEATAKDAFTPQDWRITTSTHVSFFYARYHFVFSLDLSPSISVVDTSFKGFSTGTYLSDSLLPCLEDSLRLLLARMSVGGVAYEPELFITVLAQGCPSMGMQILQQHVLCTAENIQEVLELVRTKLARLFNEQALWLQAVAEGSGSKPVRGRDCPRRRSDGRRMQSRMLECPFESAVTHNDLSAILKNCLLALSMLPVPDAMGAIVLLTDGVMCSKWPSLHFDSVLMHLNALDVAFHIVQVGGGFAPWSALGMVSDLDLLHFLVSSTPGGVLFQDHHMSSMFRRSSPEDASYASVATPLGTCGDANRLQKAWLWRASPLSIVSTGSGRTYSRGSFLSALDMSFLQEDPDEQCYIDHLQALGCKRPPKFELSGLGDNRNPVTAMTSKRLSRRESKIFRPEPGSPCVESVHQTPDRLLRRSSQNFSVKAENRDPAAFLDTEYALPGSESHSRLYDERSYVVKGVSLAHVVECRAREGFRLRERIDPARPGQEDVELEFVLNFRPMFAVYYNVKVPSTQELKASIKIQLPSREYLKYRGANKESELGEHQAKLITFVAAIQAVDMTLENITKAVIRANAWDELKKLSTQLESQDWHQWFSVQRFDFIIKRVNLESDFESRMYERLDAWCSATLSLKPHRRYWKTLRWGSLRNAALDSRAERGLQCRCCAPDGVPLPSVANRTLCAAAHGRQPQALVTGGIPPGCIVEVSELSTDDSSEHAANAPGGGAISVLVGTTGLCPHAAHALVASIKVLLFGAGAPELLGCPKRLQPEAAGAASAYSLVRPGVLSALLTGPSSPAKALVPAASTRRTSRLRTQEQTSQFVVHSGMSPGVWTACQAMDGMGGTGGSYFTFTPDWQRLQHCLPHWTWRHPLKNVHSAQFVYSIVQRLRCAVEGWHCLRNEDFALCLVKQLPLRLAGGGVGGASRALDVCDGGGTSAPASVARAGRPPELAAFDLVEGEGPSSFRLESRVLREGAAGKDAEAQLEEPPSKSGSNAEVYGAKLGEMVLGPHVDDASGDVAVGASVALGQTPAAVAALGVPTPPSAAGPVCNLYYCMHLEVPAKRYERRVLVTTLWVDAPLGTFEPWPLLPTAPPPHLLGPYCAGVHLPPGEAVCLNWEPGAVAGIRAAAAELYVQWPAPVELRFFDHAERLVLRLLCRGTGAEECEVSGQPEGACAEVMRAEARSLGGPAILVGIWVEEVVEQQSIDRQASECSAQELGAQFAAELQSRDACVSATVGFMDHLSNVAQVKRGRGFPHRAQSDPGGLHQILLADAASEQPAGMGPEVREQQKQQEGLSLGGLMRSVQHRVRLQDSSIAPRLRQSFLRGLERIDLVQQRVDFEGDGDPDVKPGHYFFYFHPLRSGSISTASLQFSVVFIPADDGVDPGPLQVYISDGNVENMRPPQVRDRDKGSHIAAALSPVDKDSYAAAAADAGASASQVADEVPGVFLSQFSMALQARIRVVHQRTYAEAVHQQLLTDSGLLADSELSTGLEACNPPASANFPLGELVAASQAANASEVLAACDYLDECLADALASQGFRGTCRGVTRDASGLSLLCCCANSDSDGSGFSNPPPVCFLQVRVSMKAADTDDPSLEPGVAAGSGTAAKRAGDSASRPPTTSAALFRAAFDAGDVQQASLEVHHLPQEPVWGGSTSRLVRGSGPRRHQICRVRWEGLGALHAWDPDVAERAARLSESLAAACYAAQADLLLSKKPESAAETQRLRRLFALLSEGSTSSEYAVSLHAAEGAELGLDFDAACLAGRESTGLVVAAAARGLVADWNDDSRNAAARIEPGDRLVEIGSFVVQSGRSGLERLPSEFREAVAKKRTLRLAFRKPAATHVYDFRVPIVRPAMYASVAHGALVEELTGSRPDASGDSLVHIADESSQDSTMLWLSPSLSLPTAKEFAEDAMSVSGIGCNVVTRHQPQSGGDPSIEDATSQPSDGDAPLRQPAAADGSKPPFWAFVVLPMQHDTKEPWVMAQLHLLFTPMFWKRCVAMGHGPPSPDAYSSKCRDMFAKAAVRMNQTLLLRQMVTMNQLSELLHRELREECPLGASANQDYDITPHDFLLKTTKSSNSVGEADSISITRQDSALSATMSVKTSPKPISPSPKQLVRRSKKQFQEEPDEEEMVRPTEDPRFVTLLPSPDALDCDLQGTVRVSLVPCLLHFNIISWLGGGDADLRKVAASTKVSFQRHKTGQHNEAAPHTAKWRLQTRCVDAVWLMVRGGGASAGDAALHFARPRYACGAALGSVDLCVDFFGLQPLSAKDEEMICSILASQLEKLAIVKLQLHTLDRQTTPALRIAVLDFLRPPNTDPGVSTLCVIPPVEKILPYTQFVRRALLGLLEPCSEAQRIEEVESSATEERSTSSFAPQFSQHQLGMQATMRFLYKRRHVEQVITDVRQYEKRGPQRRDKVGEKLLQFQGRIGDGIAFVELNFISALTGRAMDETTDVACGESLLSGALQMHGPLDAPVAAGCVNRQSGRFDSLNLELVSTIARQDGAVVGGYLLLDIWHRALDEEHAGLLAQEILFAADQALREYRLQTALLRSEAMLLGRRLDEEQLQASVAEFQASAIGLMDQMPHQHLSSLLTHAPPSLLVGPGGVRASGHLPVWSFMKTVEGLHALLQSAEAEVQSSCVVTVEGTGAAEGAPEERGPRRAHWFDCESHTRSFVLASVCRDSDHAEEGDTLSPQVFLDALSKPHTRSPRFTFLWGPTFRSWQKHLRGGSDESLNRGKTEQHEDDRDSPDLGFVHKVACHDGLLKRKHRLGQLRVDRGGAAALKKHTLQEWNEADGFLQGEGLAAPLLAVILDASGAKIRGVRIDSTMMLRVQYYLRSQFLWVWARMQLLRDICSCELRLTSDSNLSERLRSEFPWVFSRHGEPLEEHAIGRGSAEDHSTQDESLQSVHSIDQDDEAPYLFFGLNHSVVELLLGSEIVPDPGEEFLPTEPCRDRASTDTSGGAGTPLAGSAAARPPVTTAHPKHKVRGVGGASVASSLRDTLISEGQAPPSSSSTQHESMHRLAPGAVRRPPALKPRGSGTLDANEIMLKLSSDDIWSQRDDHRDRMLDAKDVLAGEPLLSSALNNDEDTGGCFSNALLVDPLIHCGRSWLEAADIRMQQYRRKMFIGRVLEEWKKEGVALVAWAQQALGAHEAKPKADEELRRWSEELEKRLPPRQRLALQDPDMFEAETLILALIHQSAVKVSDPFVEDLVIGPGLESPLMKSKPALSRGGPPAGAQQSAKDPHAAEAGAESATRRTAHLSEKLLEAMPLLTFRQRFLSCLLDAFARPSPSRDGDGAAGHWKFVFCLENPLPWQDWNGQANSHGVLMRPQTLLLHWRLKQDPPAGLLAEVACRSDYQVRVEVLAQPAAGLSEEVKKVSADFIASIRDFFFDFQLRSLMDSYNRISLGCPCNTVDALLNGDVTIEVSHPERARNMIVQGQVPARPLMGWLHPGGLSRDVSVPSGVMAKHLVNFVHAFAKQYGFECAGEAHEPIFAMNLKDSGFSRAIRERARAWDHQRGFAPRNDGAAPAAQGLRCILFACPFFMDLPRPPTDGVSGELGFRFAVVLLDSAWCTPPTFSNGTPAEHRAAWDGVAAALRSASEEALCVFCELAMANLVAMRRFHALWRSPQRTRMHDIREVLAQCPSHVDLCMANQCGQALSVLRELASMGWQTLGPYLKETFRGHSFDLLAALNPNPFGAEESWDTDVHGLNGPSGTRETARHLFIVTVVGAAQQITHAEDRHYIILHIMWDTIGGCLQELWLHSSRRLPHPKHDERLIQVPRQVCAQLQWPTLRVYADDLPEDEDRSSAAEMHLVTAEDSESSICTSLDRSGMFPCGSVTSMAENAADSAADASRHVCWESVPEVSVLVQRFVALLCDVAFAGRH